MPDDRERSRKAGRKERGTDPPRAVAEIALDWTRLIVPTLLIFLLLRTFLVQTFVITSSSMEETLLVGDFLILSKLAYGPKVPFTRIQLPGYTDPEAGDVVVFRPPHDPDLDVIKRVVGVAGDTLLMRDKALFVNGSRRPEPYAHHGDEQGDVTHPWMQWQCGEQVALSPDIPGGYRVVPEDDGQRDDECRPSRDTWGPVIVPDGQYFVMGDNRANSVDSRYWGFLERRRIRGEALAIYYSYNPELLRPLAFIRNMRPNRIGRVIR